CPVRSATREEAVRGLTHDAVSKASSGSCGQALPGANCRRGTGARHVLAPAAAVGRQRRAPGAVARLAQSTQRPPEDSLGRVLHRRQLRAGPKGGAKVGKNKRGKGTKWMVLVDGAGTPLGAYLDAASPAEVTLLEQTLA